MNIHKFGNIPKKPFHSNSYAEVANGGSIGSANSQTFGQRYTVDQNRTAILRYRDSHIGRGALRHQARKGVVVDSLRPDPIMPTSRQPQNATDPLAKPSGLPSVSPPPRSSFKEPPTRGFNPYA